MLNKIIGGIAGSQIAKSVSGIGGPTGTILGVGAMTLAKRLSLPALVAVSAGGYFAKKYLDKKAAEEAGTPKAPKVPAKKLPKVRPSAT